MSALLFFYILITVLSPPAPPPSQSAPHSGYDISWVVNKLCHITKLRQASPSPLCLDWARFLFRGNVDSEKSVSTANDPTNFPSYPLSPVFMGLDRSYAGFQGLGMCLDIAAF